jgi:5'-nucleotidase
MNFLPSRRTRTLPFSLLLSALLFSLATPAWSLTILVGNDDSCNSEGINALVDALEAAGHNVVMYAPAGEQSGKSSSISTQIGADYDISNVGFEGPTGADNRLCVRIPTESPAEGSEELLTASASPRDSGLVGLAALGAQRPDLVVTGINDGQNIGATAIASGTVGGAMAALFQGVPAIAVSRHRFAGDDGMSFEQVAHFIVDVVAQLQSAQTGDQLLPPGTGLNINTPAGAPSGIAHTQLGQRTDLMFGPTAVGDAVNLSFNGFLQLADLIGEEAASELQANPDATPADFAAAGLDTNDETSMFVAGYITITTLDGDLTATLRKRELMQVTLRELAVGAAQ